MTPLLFVALVSAHAFGILSGLAITLNKPAGVFLAAMAVLALMAGLENAL